MESNKEIKITVHALNRFSERVLNKKPLILEEDGEHMPMDEMKYIEKLITDDLQDNHKLICLVGNGECYSSEFNCTYLIKNYNLLTIKNKSHVENYKITGVIKKTKNKQTKKMLCKKLIKELDE